MGIDHEDEEVESCGSMATAASTGKQRQQQRQKLEVYGEVLGRLLDSGIEETGDSGFEDDLWFHFTRLPSRYAMDVNVERAEDVLIHKRLLKSAEDPANRPVFEVRLVHFFSPNDELLDTSHVSTGRGSVRGPPTFGSSSNLEALAHQGSETSNPYFISRPMHEITFSTIDRPKLLSQLTCLLADIGLNIQEAHAFSTSDGYSLDVFVVDGWDQEETENLRNILEREIVAFKENASPAATDVPNNVVPVMPSENIEIPSDGTDDWEINQQMLKMGNKVASGSFGDLYKGSYCSQEVAIKVLKPERLSTELLREFKQEVFIMRKIRHKNVVQFIGACTKPPNLCIVTEFMARGSIYDYLHKQNCVFKLSSLIKVAIDVSRGMNYLHQNNIIHRDLKTANLLMDENEVVKVADFGVARVLNGSGVMTAETGTYRWMAPEVIEHQPYDQKADVFSFAIVLWELITAELPYAYLTPLQAAVGVVQKDLRPTIPKNTHPRITELIVRCWERDPAKRPNFSEIIDILPSIAKEVCDDRKPAGGLFAAFRKNF